MSKALTVSKHEAISILLAQGEFGPNPEIRLKLFDLSTKLEDRESCETDESRLQLIPYITLIDKVTKKIFIYKRGKDNGDKRLTGKCSLGLGGHIETLPNADKSLLDVILEETERELQEEVGLVLTEEDRATLRTRLEKGLFELIYYHGDAVGRVHLGISLVLEVNMHEIKSHEEDIITETNWRDIDILGLKELAKEYIELEPWSVLVYLKLVNPTYRLSFGVF